MPDAADPEDPLVAAAVDRDVAAAGDPAAFDDAASLVGPDARFRAASDALLAGLEAAVAPWVVRSIVERLPSDLDDAERARWLSEAEDAARAAHDATVPALRDLLARDAEAQSVNPLAIVRGAVRFPTEVLARAGVPVADRDPFDERMFPEDRYDLSPARFDDVDESLHDVGLIWGAAKAHLVLSRHEH